MKSLLLSIALLLRVATPLLGISPLFSYEDLLPQEPEPVVIETPTEPTNNLRQIIFEVLIFEVGLENIAINKGPLTDLKDGISVSLETSGKISVSSSLDQLFTYSYSLEEFKVLAKPLLTTLEGESTTLLIGDKIPYSTTEFHTQGSSQDIKQLSTGIELKLLPTFITPNQLHVLVDISVNSIKLWRDLGSQSLPVLTNRSVTTKISVGLNEAVLIGGLFDHSKKVSRSSFPFFGKLPLLGHFFRSRQDSNQKSDMMILIQPRLYDTQVYENFMGNLL